MSNVLTSAQIDAIWDAHEEAPALTYRYYVSEAIAKAALAARPLMPVIGLPLQLDARLLNEEHAQRNHYQTLKRLAERGGLSLSEAIAIAERRPWLAMTNDEALRVLKELKNDRRYL